MWIKVAAGNHYGIFDVAGVELYQEGEKSFILYGYLARPVPHVPVGIDRGLRGEMRHVDFIKLAEFDSIQAAKDEIDSIQDFLDSESPGVYEMEAQGGAGMVA